MNKFKRMDEILTSYFENVTSEQLIHDSLNAGIIITPNDIEIIKIYMDDLRPCPEGYLLARNAENCLNLMRFFKGKIRVLSLDHDLGDDEKDGYWFVKRMIDEGLYADEIYLHSANPVGRMNMLMYLNSAQGVGMLPEHVKMHNCPIPFE